MIYTSKREIIEKLDGDLYGLFVKELASLLNAKQQLVRALPTMAEAAGSDELTSALEGHIWETKHHIKRLEQVFDSLDEPIQSNECQAMKGLIDEGQKLMKESKSPSAMDAAILSTVQKVAHYGIASFGTVCEWATKMGHDTAEDLLKATLEEEIATGEMLDEIAESISNEAYEEITKAKWLRS